MASEYEAEKTGTVIGEEAQRQALATVMAMESVKMNGVETKERTPAKDGQRARNHERDCNRDSDGDCLVCRRDGSGRRGAAAWGIGWVIPAR